MNSKFHFRASLAALGAALALLTMRAVAAVPPAENLLPSDTLALLTVPDCADLRLKLAGSPEFLWWNDPAMRPFHDRLVGKWRELFVGPIEADLGLDLASFANLPQGQFTLAITRNGWDGTDDAKTPGWVLLLDAKDKSDLLATTLQALRHKWSVSGKTVRTETAHGITFSIVPLSTNDIPAAISALVPASQPVQDVGVATKPPKSVNIVIGQFQSVLVVGDSLTTVEPVLVRLTGGTVPSLADNTQFEADKASQFHGSPAYYSWLNAHALFAALANIPAPAPNPDTAAMFTPPSVASILKASGLMGLNSISLTYDETHEGTTTTLYLSAPEATRQGLLKMLAAPQKDSGPPSFVPADAMKFWRWRLDGRKLWAELEKSLAAASPATAGSLNGFFDIANGMARQKKPDFDLRRDLMGNLGDDWLSYQRAPSDKSTQDPDGSGGIFLFAAAQPEQALQAIKTTIALYSPQEGAPAPQDFLGHTIHTLAMRPQVSTTGATAPRFLYCTIGSGYLAMSTDISVLQDYLRSAAKPPRPLAQMPGLAEAAQHVGGMNGGLFGYQNNQVVMRAAFNGLKQSGASVDAQALAMMPKALTDMLDFSLLPDYDQIAKYFYFSVFAGTTTPDGITLKGFYPRPPKVN